MIKIKYSLNDFRVTEVADIDFLEGGEYSYYLLVKAGLRTDECVSIISKIMKIEETRVSYFGLKDEDGITKQYISIYRGVNREIRYRDEYKAWFYLCHLGKGNRPCRIGGLLGNAFNIVVRNIDNNLECLSKKRILITIVNFYDIQRFGLPNRPKLAHLIGEELMAGNYEKVIELLAKSGNISDEFSCSNCNSAYNYLKKWDIRRLNFFLSAFDSFIWNRQIVNYLLDNVNDIYKYSKDEFTFCGLRALQLFGMKEFYPILRHSYSEFGRLEEHVSLRRLYNIVDCTFSCIENDEFFSGNKKMNVSFFLPSGSYATTVIDQIFNDNKMYNNILSTNDCL